MSKHIDTRRKISDIADISSFNQLLEMATITDEDKTILINHYIRGKSLSCIGDMLGYSESTIKKKHRKILSKLSRLL